MTHGALRVDVYEAHRDPAEKLTDLVPGFRYSEVSVSSIHIKNKSTRDQATVGDAYLRFVQFFIFSLNFEPNKYFGKLNVRLKII